MPVRIYKALPFPVFMGIMVLQWKTPKGKENQNERLAKSGPCNLVVGFGHRLHVIKSHWGNIRIYPFKVNSPCIFLKMRSPVVLRDA